MHTQTTPLRWYGDSSPGTDPAGIYQSLADLDRPAFVVRTPTGIGAVSGGRATPGEGFPSWPPPAHCPRALSAPRPSWPRTASGTPIWRARWRVASPRPTW